jgi:thiamine pyrophosphate-dependent acetolactate synthase large subunit-like protein
LQDAGQTAGQHAERRLRWQREHEKLIDRRTAVETKAENAPFISGPLLCRTLREVMPDNVVYIDGTVVHAAQLREHLTLDQPQSFFRIPSGLGQGIGLALGTKLALRDRPVVLLIGDGSFLYNPVIPSLMFAKANDLPVMIVIFNNNKYQAMKRAHLEYYPSGVAVTEGVFFGVTIDGPDYSTLADLIGGHGDRVEQPAALKQALSNALAAVQSGKTAVVNVVLKE